ATQRPVRRLVWRPATYLSFPRTLFRRPGKGPSLSERDCSVGPLLRRTRFSNDHAPAAGPGANGAGVRIQLAAAVVVVAWPIRATDERWYRGGPTGWLWPPVIRTRL